MKPERKHGKEKKKRRSLYEKHGYLIGVPTKELPEKHQAPAGGLRCFKKVFPRDDNGNRLKNEDKKRCGRACAKGSLYCRSHGGGNSKALVHGRRETATLAMYRKVHNGKIQDYMTAFINDPKITDMKSELVTVRAVMHNYIEKVVSGEEKPKNPKRLLRLMEKTIENEELTTMDKVLTMKEITDSIRSLDDGATIDRINRCVETVGKTIDRIQKHETKGDYMLTPEGLKIILRGVLDVLRNSIADPDLLKEVRDALKMVSIKTKGDLTKYNDVVEAEFTDATES